MSALVNDLLTVLASYTVPSVTNELITIDKSIAYISVYAHAITLWKNKVTIELRGMIFTDDAVRMASISPSTLSQTWYTYYRLINKREFGNVGIMDENLHITDINTTGTGLMLAIDNLLVSAFSQLSLYTRKRAGKPFSYIGSIFFDKGVQIIDMAYAYSYNSYYVLTERGDLYRFKDKDFRYDYFRSTNPIPNPILSNVVSIYRHYYPTYLMRGLGVVDTIAENITPHISETVIYDQLDDDVYQTYTGSAYTRDMHISDNYPPNSIALKRYARNINDSYYLFVNGDVYEVTGPKVKTRITYPVPVIGMFTTGRGTRLLFHRLSADGKIDGKPYYPFIKLLGSIDGPVIY